MKTNTPNLFGLSVAELQDVCEGAGLPRFRGEQLFYWLHNRGVETFDECMNLPKTLRAELATSFRIAHPEAVTEQHSTDGTRKFLLRLEDGRNIETVLIPSESEEAGQPKRLTICVSTQVGCPLDCRFCATASMKLKRNLTPGEIFGQYLAVQKRSASRVTNLVFMGMGEPMLNYENVMAAAELLTHEKTAAIAASHITLSTAGLADGIRRMADEGRKIKLAISLHATTDELRLRLMPINKKYPLAEIIDAAEYYHRLTRRRITWEYILFDGLNDGVDDVRRLAKLTRRVPSKVNIIPFHPIGAAYPDGMPMQLLSPPRAHIEEFAQRLRDVHVTVMLRSSSGRDIDAACGQLAVREGAREGQTRRTRAPHSDKHSEKHSDKRGDIPTADAAGKEASTPSGLDRHNPHP
ncbi:MAG: 23S rRNA (adenine(2503)-C(2))-methyltransferase RlmN [Bacteroidetes bacterium]|nr:23S rRNA (adenine(2503)-C(2))-methyltransferase RlmN [Bacteroidota bacterium]